MIKLLNGDTWDREALIEKMYDDEFYYGHLGKTAMSSSSIKLLNQSPKAYKFVTQYGQQKSSPALEIGNFIHTMVLEPHLIEERFHVVDVQSRASKAYKEAKAKSNKIVLTAKEHDSNMRIVDAVLRNEHVLSMIGGCEFEVPAIDMLEGYAFRGKADIYDAKHNFIADLKTTQDINKFEWSAESYGYDVQAFIYTELFNVPVSNFYFIAVDKGSLDIGIIGMEQSFINKGYKKLKEGLELYKKFFIEHNDIDSYTLRSTLK
tara:strand:+ start:12591 stop:13376 length:786 start_codon:yes stop_codon:yes gene_type:complete